MRSIEMSLTTTSGRSEFIQTKNVLLENKAENNTVTIYVALGETHPGPRETDYKPLYPGENIFLSSEKPNGKILRIWAYCASGTAILSITGSDGAIMKPNQVISRPAWYDRNPASKCNHYSVGTWSPHVMTVCITYTCPSGKKAMAEILSCRVTRVTAATAADEAISMWTLTPNGGSEKYPMQARLITNGVGDTKEYSIGATLMLFSGDVLTGKTADYSTDGTCHYFLAYKITEFDA